MSLPNEKILHVLTGPTAVGKTELALRWAGANNAEIVSCDSLLFYRGMDIGTAKPAPAELARVPHHLVGVCDCARQMDIARYIALARAAVDDIASRGKQILVTGGSGFYLKAFFAPVVDDIAVPPALRAEIAGQLAAEGLPALVARLRALNPEGLGALDTANPRRVTRALERCRASGLTLAELAADFARRPLPFAGWKTRIAVLDRGRDDLEKRIAIRVDAMLAAGLVDEVRRLRALGFEKNTSGSGAIGYRETLAMLDGKLPPESLAAEITKNTRALVKKQRTWFRTQLPAHKLIDADSATIGTIFAA
ncbi:tRNA dimethylallyltransferase [Ereboglobus sp. PH5-10]|uniref:tRNA (adenosine(37)-N6)-dimethylallyltransferase MiaA n=1 Tax=Ereboglobus sp. PH5-10 TaxID=2940629 RepID=UPI0024057BF5|nr:tRNA (adenosine(37)-N6)-dimethylallyltransferase MiaA [Ereboglobus sp. PH5-10]MDF9826813.1 tRNA dimethylallyltransferase [Ereboglobus sp. PH5-10]